MSISGGCNETLKAHAENKLLPMISPPTDKYDYDLIVIGGGSGGLAASKVRYQVCFSNIVLFTPLQSNTLKETKRKPTLVIW